MADLPLSSLLGASSVVRHPIGAIREFPTSTPTLNIVDGEVWLRSGYGIDETAFVAAGGAVGDLPTVVYALSTLAATTVTSAVQPISSVASNGVAVVAASASGHLGKSTNGTTWADTTIGTNQRYVATDGSRFVSIDSTGDARISTDNGVSWQAAGANLPTTPYGFTASYVAFGFAFGVFLALGVDDDGVNLRTFVVYSTNGNAWSTTGTWTTWNASGASINNASVTELGAMVVASDTNTAIHRHYRKADLTWTAQQIDPSPSATAGTLQSRLTPWGELGVGHASNTGTLSDMRDGRVAASSYSEFMSSVGPVLAIGETLIARTSSAQPQLRMDRFSAPIAYTGFNSIPVTRSAAVLNNVIYVADVSSSASLAKMTLLRAVGVLRRFGNDIACGYTKVANAASMAVTPIKLSDCAPTASGVARITRTQTSTNGNENIGPLHPRTSVVNWSGATTAASVDMYPSYVRSSSTQNIEVVEYV